MLKRFGLGRRPVAVADPGLSLWDTVPAAAVAADADGPDEESQEESHDKAAQRERAYLAAWLAWRTDELGNVRDDTQAWDARLVPSLVRLAKAQGLWPLPRPVERPVEAKETTP